MARLMTALAVFVFSAFVSAADPEKPADRAKTLIDQLTEVDRQDTGYSGSDSGTAFLPLGRNERGALLLSPRKGKFGSADTMKSLVKLGVDAVPELLKHLDDDRKTKIVIDCTGMFGAPKDPKYSVQVGDLCYVALGQIVNRDYTAVRYIPTAIVEIADVPKDKELRVELVKEWANLTAKDHLKSLAKDLDSGKKNTRNGASVRIAYYYPDALEALVLEQLARPVYDDNAVWDLVRDKLYPAKSAKERKGLVEEFVKKHGEIARDGIRWQCFYDLGPYGEARECLIDVFGYTDKVTRKDAPKEQPYSKHDQGSLIDSLLYDRSTKIDRAVRDMLAKTDDDYMGFQCLRRLVGRGYDAEIEAYLKRRLPQKKEEDREYLRRYEAKLGWTRLHAAVDLGVSDMVEAALKDKLDVNARGKDGRTALYLAAAEGKLAAVEQLLNAKADPNVKDESGRLPIQAAADADHSDTVRRLVAAKSQIPDLLVAATVGDSDRLGELLKEKGERAKERNKDGLTPLHVAAREGHETAVKVLLDAKADVNAIDAPTGNYSSPDGWTPLHLAVLAEKPAIVKLLLDHKADVNASDQRGKLTPLHYAAWIGNTDVVKALLVTKADRGVKDEKGRTPLDLAKERKHAAVMKLLEAGK